MTAALLLRSGSSASSAGAQQQQPTASSAALTKSLARFGAPFRTPSTGKVDVASLPAGPLQGALEHALRAAAGAGEGSTAAGVYALRPDGKPSALPLGYVVVAYGGDAHGAWSSALYLDRFGQKIGAAFDDA